MKEIVIGESVRSLLRSFLLEESDLVAAIHQGRQIPDPDGAAGHSRCLCAVAVRRPFDPETAILRELEVRLRETDAGLEVCAVEGLEGDDQPG